MYCCGGFEALLKTARRKYLLYISQMWVDISNITLSGGRDQKSVSKMTKFISNQFIEVSKMALKCMKNIQFRL